jgi:hypothetical protein
MRGFILAVTVALTCTVHGAQTLRVTRLDDRLSKPEPGMLRWALNQVGPRNVEFTVAGVIKLKSHITITSGDVSIDGSKGPGQGVCIRGGSLDFSGADNITVRYLRIRRGDENVTKSGGRASGSAGLDCLAFRECQNVLVEHCSLSWSCDELLSVIRCRDVVVRDCILSEPLGNPKLHPYGNNHSFAVLASASTLKIEHCLMAHYVMRGPQYEANDMRRKDNFTVQMSANDNVMFDYQHSGSRWTAGVEDHKSEAKGKRFLFTFKHNFYIPGKPSAPAVHRETKHGTHPGVKAVVEGNRVLERIGSFDDKPWLHAVGCSHWRDDVDKRVLNDLADNRLRPTIKSQRQVGGWPDLDKNTNTLQLLFGTKLR